MLGNNCFLSLFSLLMTVSQYSKAFVTELDTDDILTKLINHSCKSLFVVIVMSKCQSSVFKCLSEV